MRIIIEPILKNPKHKITYIGLYLVYSWGVEVMFMITHVILWRLERAPSGAALYKIGSGRIRNFCHLWHDSCNLLGLPRRKASIAMLEEIRPKYQYFTQAIEDRLR